MKITPERIMAACVSREPGSRIPIIIEGVIYDSVIDLYGTHRFVDDPIKRYMLYHNAKGELIDFKSHSQMLNLNTLSLAYHGGKFGKREWLEYIMSGYSISGFCSISDFHDWHINNPFWEGNVLIENDRISIIPIRIAGEEQVGADF
jgi:hypothetical protein